MKVLESMRYAFSTILVCYACYDLFLSLSKEYLYSQYLEKYQKLSLWKGETEIPHFQAHIIRSFGGAVLIKETLFTEETLSLPHSHKSPEENKQSTG